MSAADPDRRGGDNSGPLLRIGAQPLGGRPAGERRGRRLADDPVRRAMSAAARLRYRRSRSVDTRCPPAHPPRLPRRRARPRCRAQRPFASTTVARVPARMKVASSSPRPEVAMNNGRLPRHRRRSPPCAPLASRRFDPEPVPHESQRNACLEVIAAGGLQPIRLNARLVRDA